MTTSAANAETERNPRRGRQRRKVMALIVSDLEPGRNRRVHWRWFGDHPERHTVTERETGLTTDSTDSTDKERHRRRDLWVATRDTFWPASIRTIESMKSVPLEEEVSHSRQDFRRRDAADRGLNRGLH